MSKEIALLRRVKVLLECSNMEPLQRQTDLIIKEIQELLAQPVKYQFTTRLDQEPVMYQYRDKLDGKDWGRWNLCNKIDYEDYKNNPTFQHWTYQTRKLLAQPEQTKRSPLTEAEISKTLKLSRRSTEWDYGFEAGVRFAEEFHGIGGGQ